MPTVTWVGKKRRPTTGIYTVCRVNSFAWMQCKGCRACGGDGYRRVGTRRTGRGGRPRRKPRGAVKRGMWRLGIGAAFIGAGNARFGTIGAVGASVLVVGWLLLTVGAWASSRKKR